MNRLIYILVVLLPLAGFLYGCEKKPSKKPGSIYGVVTLQSNGEPVVGATVKLYRTGGSSDDGGYTYDHYMAGATTSIVGRYEFKDLLCEYKDYYWIKQYKYSIEVKARVAGISYTLSGEASTTVEPGKECRVDIEVK